MIRSIAFDFDGTLVQSNAVKHQAVFDAVADVTDGQGVVDQMLAEGITGDRHALFAELARRLTPKNDDPLDLGQRLARRYSEICAVAIARCPEVAGASHTLRMLAGDGLALYLVSATPEIDLQPIVAARGMTPFFRAVLGGPRPKPRQLAVILANETLRPQQLVVVGDQADDRAAAAEVGCHFLPVAGDDRSAMRDDPEALLDLKDLPARLAALDAAEPEKHAQVAGTRGQ